MADEKTPFEFTPVFIEKEPDLQLPEIDTPEKIARDLLRTEKEIATETLRIMRSRYEREKDAWDRVLAEKERDRFTMKTHLSEAEDRLRRMQEQLDTERHRQLEHISDTARQIEVRRTADTKKWEMITDEVKSFRDSAIEAQNKLATEQSRVGELKKQLAEQEKNFKDQLRAREEELLDMKEEIARKEELRLGLQAQKEEEIHLLQEQVDVFKKTLEEERQQQGKILEKKEGDLAGLQTALQDTIIRLNEERQANDRKEEQIAELRVQVQGMQEDLKKREAEFDAERSQWTKMLRDGEASWEKYKQDCVLREETLKRETDEQIKRVLKAVELIEQQLSDEQVLRSETENKLQVKEQEIQNLTLQKNQLAAEWKKLLDEEHAAMAKHQADLLAEFEKIRVSRETEMLALKDEAQKLQAALAEEKKIFAFEKDEKIQLGQKLLYMEESRQKLVEQLDGKEKQWQETIGGEQELFGRQIEELRLKAESQIQSRDKEIERLNEDLTLLNGQVLELKQKLALEKNENNNRLNRVSELETEIRSLTAKFTDEFQENERKTKFLQQQWDEQKKGMLAYQKRLEVRLQEIVQLSGASHLPADARDAAETTPPENDMPGENGTPEKK